MTKMAVQDESPADEGGVLNVRVDDGDSHDFRRRRVRRVKRTGRRGVCLPLPFQPPKLNRCAASAFQTFYLHRIENASSPIRFDT
jgi:hypothetical protein